MSDDLPSRGERTRSDIIQAAHQLFLDHGFHGTSMRQIAEKAGIAVGGIYNHFPGKEDLFAAVIDAYHPYHEILPAMKAEIGDSVDEYVSRTAKNLVAALERRPDLLNLMFIEIVEFKAQHLPQLFARIYPQFITVVQGFTDKQDKLRPIPVPLLVRAFLGMFFSFYITEVILAKHLPPALGQNGLESFVDIFLHGIVEPDSSKEAE